MAEVEVMVNRVGCVGLSEKGKADSEVTFDVNASLSEVDKNEGSLALKFDIEVETQPPLAKLSLAGSAIVKGESEEIQNLINSKNGNSVPPVFMKIYQKVYEIMYLLSGSLSIPYPAPGLLKTTHLYSGRDIAQPLEVVSKQSLM